MEPCTNSPFEDFPERLLAQEPLVEIVQVQSLPKPQPLEADIFERQNRVPGMLAGILPHTRAVFAGAGGLNSWAAAALLRAGLGSATLIDPDTVERTNLTRQLFKPEDLGKPKAIRLAHNLAEHAVQPAQMLAIAARFEEAIERYPLPADILIAGVDNNSCRQAAAQFARQRQIPAVFTMLSRDGLRCQVFLQGADRYDACLWCALPNLDVEKAMPCAAAFVSSVLLASAYTTFFALRALMGWPDDTRPFNWREADLFGLSLERTGFVKQRPDCPLCSPFRHQAPGDSNG